MGGNLRIESLQDSGTYHSRSSSLGGSVIFGPGGVPTGGSLSASRSAVDSDFKSVGEQSAIRAGDGGFQVSVAGKTELVGGQVTATQQAVQDGKNSFSSHDPRLVNPSKRVPQALTRSL